MKTKHINPKQRPLNKNYIGAAEREISAEELREIVRNNKDSGYHRECLQAANRIERLERELKDATK